MTTEKDITLGEFLRHERERRGITIDQVASATKVGVRTLHSLEADHFADLPAKPFIRGFVTSYCRFIGLEPKEVLARFEDFISRKATERPNREGGHSGYAFERKDGDQQSRTILMIAICSFIVVGGLAMIFLKPSLRHRHHSHIDKLRAAHGTHGQNVTLATSPSPLVSSSPLAQTGVSNPAPAPSPAPSVSPAPQPSSVSRVSAVTTETAETTQKVAGANPDDPLDSGLNLKAEEIHHRVVFKVLADIWVRYQVDQRPMRKFIVRKGKTLVLRGSEGIRAQVSNPNSVSFNYNGKKSVLVSDAKSQTLVRHGAAILFFPHELAEKIDKPFEDDKPLPETEDPVPESISTPTAVSP